MVAVSTHSIRLEPAAVPDSRYATAVADTTSGSYIVHVEVLGDRPAYRSVVSIDVGGTIHHVPEARFREILEESRFFRRLLAPGAVYEAVSRELQTIADET